MIDKFICVHILKTAGTTLKENFLLPVYKERCLIDMSFKPKNNSADDKRRRTRRVELENQSYPPDYENYDVIFGHFKGDKYVHLNRPMFSFIRHPVDRIISHYYFSNRLNILLKRGLSLIDFAKIHQNYTTYVLGDISKYEYIGIVEDFNKSLEKMCDILGVDCPNNIKPERVSRMYTPDQISKDVRKEIENMNLKDMELYNKVIDKE